MAKNKPRNKQSRHGRNRNKKGTAKHDEAWRKQWQNTESGLATGASSSCILAARSCLNGRLLLLLLLDLEEEGPVDVRQDTAKGNGGADQGVKFLVTANGKLEMARCNALDLEILCGVLKRRDMSVKGQARVAMCCAQGARDKGQIKRRKTGGKTYACQLKYLSSQVLEDGRHVHRSLGANAHLVLGVGLEETLNTAAGELGLMSVIQIVNIWLLRSVAF